MKTAANWVVQTVAVLCIAGCGHTTSVTPEVVAPVVAAPPAKLGDVRDECDHLVASLAKYASCVPENQRSVLEAWGERAALDVHAAADPGITAEDRAKVARSCHQAASSLDAAVERCSKSR